jgi:Spy/CpxP family protein refolding chaperone
MRANAVLGGLLLILGLTVPVAAQTSDVALAIHEDDAAGRAMGGPSMQGRRGYGGWQQRAGQGQMRRGRSFVGMVLRHRQELGLSQQQVDSLRKLGMDSRRAAIRRTADMRLAQLDLMELRLSDPVDMGKVEAKVREIERTRADGRIAVIRTTEQAKAQLTADQKEKLKGLWAARWQRMRQGSGGMEAPAEADEEP